jgi:thioredoxin reductase (NADPH)
MSPSHPALDAVTTSDLYLVGRRSTPHVFVVRGASLGERMSQYLVERCESHPKIAVRTRSTVTRALGVGKLEQLRIADALAGVEAVVAADALFVLIGGEPRTAGVEGWLKRDRRGFLVTGPELLRDGRRDRWWTLDRDPFFLESSQPGAFVAGDVRRGSIKRVASAVGEGAMAVQLVHQYLGTIR